MTYLCIYKKKNKLYFATVKRLSDRIGITNQDFQTVVLGYRQKIRSFPLNVTGDLIRFYPELKRDYAGKIYIIENRFKEKTQIKMVMFLLNNPFWEVALHEREEENDVEEGKCSTKSIEIETKEDIELAEKEFDFSDEFVYNFV